MSFFRQPIHEHVAGDAPTTEEIREALTVWASADQPCRAWCSRANSGREKCPPAVTEEERKSGDLVCWLEAVISRLPPGENAP